MSLSQLSAHSDAHTKRLTRRRRLTFVGITLFAALLATYKGCSYERQVSVLYLQLLTKSSVSSIAQVFYDTGNGLSEDESQTQTLEAGDTFQSLKFPLPPRPIRLLRFDPLTGPGRVVLRKATLINYNGSAEQVLPLESLRATNDIASMQLKAEGLVTETTPNTNDPQTVF